MSLVGRKINTFRCQVDPMVGPKPRNAFVPSQMAMEAEMAQHGVYVKVLAHGTFMGSEHLIPFANIQSIRLEPPDPIQAPNNDAHPEGDLELTVAKRKPGRPVGS